jgi:hypothetical protein
MNDNVKYHVILDLTQEQIAEVKIKAIKHRIPIRELIRRMIMYYMDTTVKEENN